MSQSTFLGRRLLSPRLSLAVAVAMSGMAVSAQAATRPWTGAGADDFWSTATNWTGGSPVTTDVAQFGTVDAQALPSTINNIVAANRTIDRLRYITTGTAWQNTQINSGVTLTIVGSTGFGLDAGSGGSGALQTQATISGDGSIVAGGTNLAFGLGLGTGTGDYNFGTVDMSKLASLTANLGPSGLVRIGDPATASSSAIATFNVSLAKETVITAGTFDVGNTTFHGGTQVLRLGSTSNVLNANTFNIGAGTGRSGGSLDFGSATGTLQVRAANGTSRAAFNVVNASTGTALDISSSANFGAHSSDLLLSTLTIGSRSAAGAATTADFTMGTGTLDATTVTIANNTGTAAALTGTLNITGGTNAIGSITSANAATGRTATANINLTGGATTLAGNITRTGGLGTSITNLNLDGGTLNMSGNQIGSATTPVTFLAKSGTLQNLGQLNGGGALTKTTGGTLSLEGTDTYTGATNINAGIFAVNGVHTLGGSYTVSGTGTLGGSGSTTSTVTIGSTGFVAPGNSIGTLTTGNTTLNGTYALEVNNVGGSDLLNVLGLLSIDSTTSALSLVGGTLNPLLTYIIANSTGPVGGTFATVDPTILATHSVDYTLNQVRLLPTAVPEPVLIGMIGLAMTGLLGRRRRTVA